MSVVPVALTPLALLCDRDGTLVRDVPYNRDPNLVEPLPGVADALRGARAAGLRTAVVSNQSGVARGLVTRSELDAVNARVDQLLGGFDAVLCCIHDPDAGCSCRKPRPGLVIEAARRLGVPVASCVVVGDIASDVEAASTAGASGILVPTARTRPAEVLEQPIVMPTFAAAVAEVLRWL